MDFRSNQYHPNIWLLLVILSSIFCLTTCMTAAASDQHPNTLVCIKQLKERARTGGASRVVYDLVFWARYGNDTTHEILEPLALAKTISKQSQNKPLVLLCDAARQNRHTLPISKADASLRRFQALCRSYESLTNDSDQPSEIRLTQLKQIQSELTTSKSYLATAVVGEKMAEILLFRLNRNSDAEQEYEATLSLYSQMQLSYAQARIYDDLGYSYQSQALYSAAERYYYEAGNHYAGSGRMSEAAQSLQASAQNLLLLRRFNEAQHRIDTSVRYAERGYVLGGSVKELIRRLSEAAELSSRAENPDRSIKLLRRALELASRSNLIDLKIKLLPELASRLADRGQLQESKRYLQQESQIRAQWIPKLKKEIKTLQLKSSSKSIRLGEALMELGWLLERSDKASQAADIYRQAALFWEKHQHSGRALDALMGCRRVLPSSCTADEIALAAEKSMSWETACQEWIDLANRDSEQSFDYAEKSLQTARKSKNPVLIFQAASLVGQTYLKMNQPDQARECYYEAIKASREFACDLNSLNQTFLSLVEIEKCRGNQEICQSLLSAWEERVITHPQAKTPIATELLETDASVRLTTDLISGELNANRKPHACQVIRDLSETTAFEPVVRFVLDHHPEWKSLLPDSVARTRMIASGRESTLAWLAQEYATASGSGLQINQEIRKALRQIASSSDDWGYLRYLRTPAKLYALVARGSQVEVVCLGSVSNFDSSLEQLQQEVIVAQTRLSQGKTLPDDATPENDSLIRELANLHQLLLEPLDSFFQGTKNLIVELPAEANWLPLHALYSSQKHCYVIDEYAVSYLDPVMSEFSTQSIKRSLEPLLILQGDTPQATSEAQALKESFPSCRLLKGSQIAERYEEELMSARSLHIATHFVPGQGILRFGSSNTIDIISQENLYRLQLLSLELAVLFCCESAGTAQTGIGGMFSLVDSFALAGAHTVVGTLWRVSDRASEALARQFYTELANGTPCAQALQRAQCHLRHLTGLEHPFYWSAFALYGDPR